MLPYPWPMFVLSVVSPLQYVSVGSPFSVCHLKFVALEVGPNQTRSPWSVVICGAACLTTDRKVSLGVVKMRPGASGSPVALISHTGGLKGTDLYILYGQEVAFLTPPTS